MQARLIALFVAVALIGGAFFLRARTGGGSSGTPSTDNSSNQPPSAGAAEMLCPPETMAMCEAAVTAFNNRKQKVRGRTASVRISVADTATAANDLKEGARHPVLWLAPSGVWIDRVNARVTERTGSDLIRRDGEYQAAVVAVSPIVIAAWADRAAVLTQACPVGVGIQCLHDQAVRPGGWKDIGGQASWGLVDLSHAKPSANDGLITLAVMAYVQTGRASGLLEGDIDDPRVAQFIENLDQAVPQFPSGDVATAVVAGGPAVADVAITYEHTIAARLDNARGRYPPEGMRVFYPERILLSEFTIAVLLDPATSADDKDVGVAFRNFLLSPEGQAVVARSGMRSGVPGVPVPADSPLVAHVDEGVVLVLPADRLAEQPQPSVLDALDQLWRERVNR